MAQKELLHVLILSSLFFLISPSIWALEEEIKDIKTFEFSSSDFELAKEISNEGRYHSMQAIKEKLRELKKMRSSLPDGMEKNTYANLDEELANFEENNLVLKVFVSSSMSKTLLKDYAKKAKKFGAVLIFNGLQNNSWRDLSSLVYEITDGGQEEIAMQIDDTAFEVYSITKVPSFVLVKQDNIFSDKQQDKEIFDKITGNIGIRRALEEFSEKGELAKEAKQLLSKTLGENS